MEFDDLNSELDSLENSNFLIRTELTDGMVMNTLNHPRILAQAEKLNTQPDGYFCFLIKTLVDDYGDFLVKITGGKTNKEQFEAIFIQNLSEFLSEPTRLEESDDN